MVRLFFIRPLWALLAMCFLQAACDTPGTVSPSSSGEATPQPELLPRKDRRYKNTGKLFGEQGLSLGAQEDETGIGVSAYLWRGTLDVLAPFPLQTTDPFGGLVTTDWYTPPSTSNEQFKVNVVILSRQLRSDGLNVRVLRREKTAGGAWKETPAHSSLQRHFKEVILLRARDLKAKEHER
ncbi:MAG: DUF3576 domain-containing protein [Alphaproteobacteria bacterium]